jgi:molybdopterin converting factor small subunit
MKITVKYKSQVKKETGISSEELVISENETVQVVLKRLSEKYGDRFENLLFDNSGIFKNTILLAINNSQTLYPENISFKDADTLTIMSPIAGG